MKKIVALTAPVVISSLISASSVFAATPAPTVKVPTGFTTQTFASGITGTAATLKNPDDITTLNGNMIVAYQNGVGSKGEPSSNGVGQSTLVEYDNTGKVVQQWNVTGKIDGMTADPANNRILASVNEDGNSSMYVITPGNKTPQHLTYSGLTHGGGTDSIVVSNGKVYISASAPAADANGTTYSKPALYQANIDTTKGVVTLTSALADNATAQSVNTGKSETLNLSDPDSSIVVPQSSSKFAGDFMLDSQGDSELIFINNLGQSGQSQQVLHLSDPSNPTNPPQVDDVIWATSSKGTLYISDSGANKVYAVKGYFTPGTVFASNGTSVGTLDLTTGKVTPFITGLSSSHGMIFIPDNSTAQITTPTTSATSGKSAPSTPSTSSTSSTTSTTSTPVQGATSPKTGFALEELLMEGLGLLTLGGGTTAAFLRKRKK